MRPHVVGKVSTIKAVVSKLLRLLSCLQLKVDSAVHLQYLPRSSSRTQCRFQTSSSRANIIFATTDMAAMKVHCHTADSLAAPALPCKALRASRLAALHTSLPRTMPNRVQGASIAARRLRGDKLVTASAETTISSTSSDFLEQEEFPKDGFQWFSHWYPVHVVDHLDSGRPHHLKLLGKDLVLWCDKSGRWNCFEDKCPHRLAPLSEGRIEDDGSLLCAYHAWRFDSTGKCTDLPQAKTPVSGWNPKTIPCATSFPVKVAGSGVIFVWPQAGPEAEATAATTEPRGFEEMLGGDRTLADGTVLHTKWGVRDLPYGWDFFMENVNDPAHVPVSHHNMVGNRYDDPRYFDLLPIDKITVQDGFRYAPSNEFMEDKKNLGSGSFWFSPPCFVRIQSPFVNGVEANICLYATPTTPGYTRAITSQVFRLEKPFAASLTGLSAFALSCMPRWVSHVFGAKFIHQDQVFLHHQEKIVHQMMEIGEIKKPADGYDMPTPSDKMVILFRQWYHQMSSGGIPWAPGTPGMPPAERDSSKLFDTYNAHTKHCKSCQGAIKGTELGRLACAVGAAFAFAAGVVMYASYSASLAAAAAATGKGAAISFTSSLVPMVLCAPPVAVVALFLLSAGLIALRAALGNLKQMFYLVEYSHADNN